MTRKKFIKMLAANGVGRNQAAALAKITQQIGVPYFKALGDFLTLCHLRRINLMEGRLVLWQAPGTNCWAGGGGIE